MLVVIQYSDLVKRIKKERGTSLSLCRCPRMNVVVLLSKKGNTTVREVG